MIEALIVSKTHMLSNACVGGILRNGRFVRLLDGNGRNQPSNTDIEIGDVYTITFRDRQDKRPPHVEDILIDSMKYEYSLSSQDMVECLIHDLKVNIWKGSTERLFNGTLQWTRGGSGFVSESGAIPENSVGFWIPDKDLTRKDFNDKVRYSYPIRYRDISFVGFQNPVDKIPAGTLVRVSLARWWSPNEEEKRCYLQLSGWYGMREQENLSDSDNDDFQF